jgi:hypothetical protein
MAAFLLYGNAESIFAGVQFEQCAPVFVLFVKVVEIVTVLFYNGFGSMLTKTD